jgi:hypothetical protein
VSVSRAWPAQHDRGKAEQRYASTGAQSNNSGESRIPQFESSHGDSGPTKQG